MGSSASVSMANTVYLSYDSSFQTNRYIQLLSEEIENFNYIIVNSEMTKVIENLKNIDLFIRDSKYIIIGITPKTIRSIQQIIEINSAWDYKKNIIFIMLDENYTPLSEPTLLSIIKKKHLAPFL